ncbi:MAG: transglycosylase domain-containing protein [Thiobacillaceae bacterium]|nr:transglycosylase domain-containing protein [Thiobacillaceae bacterium]
MQGGALFRRPPRRWLWPLAILAALAAAVIAAYELIASPLQAQFLAHYGERLTFSLGEGESPSIRFPAHGPHDIRLGYVGLPRFIERLKSAGFVVTHQARISPEMARLDDWGLFLPYHEKTVAGLTVLDCRGDALYRVRYPRQAYPDFEAIPPVIANTLLYIENRELLDPNHPQRNPAVEWDRLAQAVLEKAMQVVDPNRNVPGGSTLATQIEKYRHSPDGLTLTATDKLRQMASASLRAYLDGPDTRATRRRIVRDYLNSVPLAAAPGFGEVHGLAEGLRAWFDLDFDRVNQLLARPELNPEAARAYKHVLALLVAQRKPSWYLLAGRDLLARQVDVHLKLMAEAGIISPQLRDLALREPLRFASRTAKPANGGGSFIEQKAANAIRVELSQRLGVPGLYDLDRLDLTAHATLHLPTQRAIADFLSRLDDPVLVEAAGLYGPYLLAPDDDLKKPIYSFTLYELTEQGALLRVQADNLNQPFDINRQAKLDMGSSAKIRTLITYLGIIAELHAQYAGLTAKQLAAVKPAEKDVLTQWVVNYLKTASDRSLQATLEAAMGRMYSASPAETFYTGGGVHRFANFKREDDTKVMDLWEATRHSVNLPFIRLMRDIVRHFMYRAPSTAARVLADAENPQRQTYLIKFADQEGRAFLARFYKKYKGLTPEEATANLINHLAAHPRRLAAVYRYLEPQADLEAFKRFMQGRLANPGAFDDADYAALYESYGPDRFSLSDRGYITQIHPLELWLVAYLRQHPKATWNDIVQASTKERVQVYDWLFKTGRKNAQDLRILSLLEIEAFQEIHRRWQKLGYPFSSLVPSYATAIGSSADRPAALAELIGVILNDGRRLAPVSLTKLEFAAGTPYHTVLQRVKPQAEQVYPPEVARVMRKALIDVVQNGTARRLKNAFPLADGGHLVIGGKTGTGDHRYETYAPNGAVIESKVMNRTATFAFFMGNRFYGVMTVFVPGEAAADYHFTSGLAVQIVKTMEPTLRPLVVAEMPPEPTWEQWMAQFEAETTAGGAKPRVSTLTEAPPAPIAAAADRAPSPPARAADRPADKTTMPGAAADPPASKTPQTQKTAPAKPSAGAAHDPGKVPPASAAAAKPAAIPSPKAASDAPKPTEAARPPGEAAGDGVAGVSPEPPAKPIEPARPARRPSPWEEGEALWPSANP